MNTTALAPRKTAGELRQIKGSIADAIRERVERISKRIDDLAAHLAHCPDCQTESPPYRLCGTGNRLFNLVIEE